MKSIVVFLCLVGCARVEFRRATGPNDVGLHYYRPAPYLTVARQAIGGCSAQVIWLPDYTQEFVAIPHAGLGTLDFKPTLQDGWNLVSMESSTSPQIAEILTGLGGIAGAVIPLVGTRAAISGTPLAPGLYKLNLQAPVQASTSAVAPALTPVFADVSPCQGVAVHE